MRFRTLFAITICLALLQGAAWSTEPPRYLGLTILHTNDIHGHLFPLDYYDDQHAGSNIHLKDVGGAARQATLIRHVKTTSPYPVLVMSAGDVFTRGPIGYMHGQPDFDVMNAIPYDVMTLGNNEFEGGDGDAGQQVLFDRIRQARFPVLSANVLYKSTGKTIVPPHKIFEIDGVRIAVFGLTAPRVANYSTSKDLDVQDPIAVAKTTVAELRDKADFVIALTHIGYNGDLELAKQVPGIDVIIGGDSHTWLKEPTLVAGAEGNPAFVDGTIVNQAGEWGLTVDELDLRLRRAEGHRYRVMSYSSKIIDVDSSYAPAPDIAAILNRYTAPLRGVIATLDKDIPKPEMGNWLAQCLMETAGVQIGVTIQNPIECGLKAGVVTKLSLRQVYPSETKLLKGRITGKQLKDFVTKSRPFLAGAKLVDGELYVGDGKVVDTVNYTIAVDDFWGLKDTDLGKAELNRTDMTVWDAMAVQVRKATKN